MGYLKGFKTHIANHDYPGFLKLWEEYCSGDELDGEEVCEVLRAVKRSDIAEPFGRHVERILPLWELMGPNDLSHEVLRLIVDVATTNHESLAQLVCTQLKTRYGNDVHFNEKMRLIGLKNKEKLQGAISNYELLSHMEKGNFVFHSSGWGVGQIIDVSLIREQLSLEFDYVPGKKEVSFATAFKTLAPIPPTHFLARRFGNPDALEKQAKEEPVEVIRLLLRDLGPKTAAEIKDELCDLVIPSGEWSRWWQTTRSKLKKNTLISSPEDSKEPFALLKQELSHEDRFKQTLENPADTSELISMVYSFARDFPETLKNLPFKAMIVAKLQEALKTQGLATSQQMGLLFLLQDLQPSKESDTIAAIVKKSDSICSLIDSIGVQAFRKRLLVEVRKVRSDWKELFMELLFKVDTGSLRDYILSELIAAKAEGAFRHALEGLSIHPGKHPDVFMWYFQKVHSQKNVPFSDKQGKIRFFEGLMILLSVIENKPEHRDLVKKIHGILTEGRFALVREMMQQASLEQVSEFILLGSKCHSLSDHDQKIFQSLAEVVYPELAKGKKKEENGGQEEDSIIWTTQEGFNKLHARIQEIATVETVENAQEIEVARAHGDLRENAEFKAALERRSRLQGELKLLSEQLKVARVITKADIDSDTVGIGTIVGCTDKEGKPVSYTLLGPWDADPDAYILSFQSKLAQSMKGKKVGDSFQTPLGLLTIVSIRSFL